MKSILQSRQWASFKSNFDFEIIELDGHFIHKRHLPYQQSFLYLPEVSAQDFSAGSTEELKKLSKRENSIFVRLELIDEFTDNAHKLLQSLGFVKAFEELQPKFRQVIDLTKTRGEILAQMKQKGRYNIKLAERRGVKVEHFPLEGIDKKQLKFFYTLLQETVKREGISGRSLDYFEKMAESFAGTDYLEVYIASYKNEPAAAALVSFYDKTSLYLYGGSSRIHSDVMAPYLMHWQIMCDGKDRGMTSYDLLGRSKPGKDSHKWAGITRFKEQFGGRSVEILGSYDYINKPFLYRIFKIAENLRRK